MPLVNKRRVFTALALFLLAIIIGALYNIFNINSDSMDQLWKEIVFMQGYESIDLINDSRLSDRFMKEFH